MNGGGRGPILTLEPLVEAVREGVEGAGWKLSGLQKTTSHEFEGRWAGESTRSAYLFFHSPTEEDHVSIDVFLDETSRGLRGNLALALEGRRLGDIEGVQALLRRLGEAAGQHLLEGYRTPIVLRIRDTGRQSAPHDADTECRFKLHIPKTAIDAGWGAVSALSTAAVQSFEDLLAASVIADFRTHPDAPREG